MLSCSRLGLRPNCTLVPSVTKISNVPVPNIHQKKSSRRTVTVSSIDHDKLGDFGARDPYPGEIASNFGDKVLGYADTEHRISFPEKIRCIATKNMIFQSIQLVTNTSFQRYFRVSTIQM